MSSERPGDHRFWRLVDHYISLSSSKLWRANAENLILKQYKRDPYPELFKELQGHPTRLLELAWALRTAINDDAYIRISCKEFVYNCLKDASELGKDMEMTVMQLKVLTEFSHFVPTNSLFNFIIKCCEFSPLYEKLALGCWNKVVGRSFNVTLQTQTDFDAFVHTNNLREKVERFAWKLPEFSEELLVSAFIQDRPNFVLEMLHIEKTLESTDAALHQFFHSLTSIAKPNAIELWTRLLISSKKDDDLPSAQLAVSLLKYYLGLATLLPEQIEHLEQQLSNRKCLEKFVVLACRVLARSPFHSLMEDLVASLQSTDSWKWVWNLPSMARLLIKSLWTYWPTIVNGSPIENGFWTRLNEALVIDPELLLPDGLLEMALERQDCPLAVKFAWNAANRLGLSVDINLNFDAVRKHIDESWIFSSFSSRFFAKHKIFDSSQADLRLSAVLCKKQIALEDDIIVSILDHLRADIELHKESFGHAFQILKTLSSSREDCSKLFCELNGSPVHESSEIQAQFEALVEPLEHDHDHVVGYSSCCAECYCD